MHVTGKWSDHQTTVYIDGVDVDIDCGVSIANYGDEVIFQEVRITLTPEHPLWERIKFPDIENFVE